MACSAGVSPLKACLPVKISVEIFSEQAAMSHGELEYVISAPLQGKHDNLFTCCIGANIMVAMAAVI